METAAIETFKGQEQGQKRFVSLSGLLRFLGTMILLSSPAIFMLQQWGEMNHIARYLSFLGLTGLIASTGFFCAMKLKETKGARTLLGISAAVLPVHFLQIGALIYSRVGDTAPNIPEYFIWRAPSAGSLIVVTAAALCTLIPIAFISFSALARAGARELTAVYIAGCLFLLIPTRDPLLIASAGAAAFAVVSTLDAMRFRDEAGLRTFEGHLCRLLCYMPVVMLFARQVYLYDANQTFQGMMLMIGSALFFLTFPMVIKDRAAAILSQFVGLVIGWAGLGLLVSPALEAFGLGTTLPNILHMLPYAVFAYALSFKAIDMQSFYRKIALGIAAFAVIGELVDSTSLTSMGVCLVLSMPIIIHGYQTQSRLTFAVGSLCFLGALVDFVRFAIPFASISPWVVMAVIGLATVVISSYLERDGARVSGAFLNLRRRFGLN